MDDWSRVSIVGIGLIGESLARALRRARPELRLSGIDSASVVADARARSVIDDGIALDLPSAAQACFAGSDLVVLAAPVAAIRRWLPLALDRAPLVTDCGSTKRCIAAAAAAHPRGGRFVPGHPMAGAGGGGVAGARADLFEGQPWVLCGDRSDPDASSAVEACVTRIGARPVRLDAAAHDAAVAVTSHAPRLVASALTRLAHREGAFEAAGPAFERLSRGAGGSTAVWGDVLASNGDEVARVLRHLLAELGACADELERGGEVGRRLDTIAEAELARRAFAARRG
jgi:prephenate dehydrogenase